MDVSRLLTRDGRCERDNERRVKAGNLVNGAMHSFMGVKTRASDYLSGRKYVVLSDLIFFLNYQTKQSHSTRL